MELVNLSWLFAYFMNATQAATPSVPRMTNAGHLRYRTVNATHRQKRQLGLVQRMKLGIEGEGFTSRVGRSRFGAGLA